MNYFRNHRTIFIIIGIVTLVLGIMATLVYYVLDNYKVNTVYVDGNNHYSDMDVRMMVMDGPLGDNSLFLSMKYKNKSIEDVPFVSKMSVEVIDPNTIRITVYEKAVAGYVEYLERYMYFDKDGVVIEASDTKSNDVPLVTGLSFDHVMIHETLPVENKDIFASILSITQLVNKYALSLDRLYFAPDGSITLYFEDVRVALGESTNLDEKVMKLQYILPELEGQRGVLRMENYTEDTQNVSFEPDTD